MDSPPFCSALRHPVSKGWGIFVCFSPYLLEASPVYNVLRYPLVKGWGIYGNFFPYLAGTLPLHGFLRHLTGKGMGVFRDFYPYLLDCTRPLLHSLSAFKIYPPIIKQVSRTAHPSSAPDGLASAWRTPQCRFLYGTVSRVPAVQKEAVFLYRMYPQAARVQQKAPFLYRTENRLKVIEF